MFKSIGTTLITGFITVLPVVLTIYLLYWLVLSSEQVMGAALRYVLPEVTYFPGLGTLVGLIVIFMIGLLMKAVLVRQLFALGENVLYHLPIIKTIYRAIRDLFDFFSPKQESFGRVVIVDIAGMEIVGFVTQENRERLPQAYRDSDADSLLVYLPMSYMIGGFTMLVPREKTRPCNMSMEEAMRFALTAGITGKRNDTTRPRIKKT
jgi:uncharacterized membrane protein